jgi:protein-tyrosine phosphatase
MWKAIRKLPIWAAAIMTLAHGAAAAAQGGVALGLAGAANFRDVGGYQTADGRHVRRGEVYRSNELSKLTPADALKVDSLHLAAVIDLRTEEERKRAPSAWLNVPGDVYDSPKVSLADTMHEIFQNAGTAEGARRGISNFYAHMPDEYHDEYAAMFRRIAAHRLPLLVHCTAGKDRTGVAVALLLTSVGVPRQTVIEDYTLTETLLPEPQGAALGPLAQLPEDSRRALWRADPDYIRAALESIDREYGSVNGYLVHGLGLSPAEIRRVRQAIVE